MAAKVYHALGMRILVAKRSTYYGAALSNFEDAKRCYERSGLYPDWILQKCPVGTALSPPWWGRVVT